MHHHNGRLMRQIVLAFLLLFLFSACEERIKPTVLGDLRGRELPSHESWNTTITFSESGTIKAILRVGHLAKYDDQNVTLLDGGIQVDFFNARGERTSVLTSREGKVFDETRDFEAIGNVVVVSADGTTLRTERLFWKNSVRRVYSDEFVTIVTPKEEIQGHGFESDENLMNYKIFRVTGKTTVGE